MPLIPNILAVSTPVPSWGPRCQRRKPSLQGRTVLLLGFLACAQRARLRLVLVRPSFSVPVSFLHTRSCAALRELTDVRFLRNNGEASAGVEEERRQHHLMDTQPSDRVLIFVETKKGADMLTRSLNSSKYPASAMHGDKSQGERDQALLDFRSGRSPIMVATDVAARGLDVKDVLVVVNFDMPNNIEE